MAGQHSPNSSTQGSFDVQFGRAFLTRAAVLSASGSGMVLTPAMACAVCAQHDHPSEIVNHKTWPPPNAVDPTQPIPPGGEPDYRRHPEPEVRRRFTLFSPWRGTRPQLARGRGASGFGRLYSGSSVCREWCRIHRSKAHLRAWRRWRRTGCAQVLESPEYP